MNICTSCSAVCPGQRAPRCPPGIAMAEFAGAQWPTQCCWGDGGAVPAGQSRSLLTRLAPAQLAHLKEEKKGGCVGSPASAPTGGKGAWCRVALRQSNGAQCPVRVPAPCRLPPSSDGRSCDRLPVTQSARPSIVRLTVWKQGCLPGTGRSGLEQTPIPSVHECALTSGEESVA